MVLADLVETGRLIHNGNSDLEIGLGDLRKDDRPWGGVVRRMGPKVPPKVAAAVDAVAMAFVDYGKERVRRLSIEPAEPEKRACKNCRFWRAGKPVDYGALRALNADKGRCQRNPPVPNGDHGQWPVTMADDLCGEYQPVKLKVGDEFRPA